MSKDGWDKLDIAAKALGAIVVPIVIGLVVWAWNAERTVRDTSAQMISIATSILTEVPGENAPDPIRNWAIDVLQNPADPPRLSDEAADSLRSRPLPWSVKSYKGALWLNPSAIDPEMVIPESGANAMKQ